MDRTNAKRLLGSIFFTLTLTLIFQALKSYGVVSVIVGELCLVGAWLVGIIGLVFSEWTWNRSVREKIFITTIGAVIYGVVLLEFNDWAMAHRPEVNRAASVSASAPIPTPAPPPVAPTRHHSEQPSDPRIALVRNARVMADQLIGLTRHFEQTVSRLEKEYGNEAEGKPDEYTREHIEPFFRHDLQEAREYEQNRYEHEFKAQAIDLRHKLMRAATDAMEPQIFTGKYGDTQYEHPTAVEMEELGSDLIALANAVQKHIEEQPNLNPH